MELYYAPNTRAVRSAWLLQDLGLEFDVERFTLGDPSTPSSEFRKINPYGRVPVLDDGDVRLSESTAIAQYLVVRYGNGRFAPNVSSAEFPVYLQWLHYGEGMITGQMNNCIEETVFLPRSGRRRSMPRER